MAEVLNTRLLYDVDGARKEAMAGDPVPDNLSPDLRAELVAQGLVVDESEFVDDGERPWAVETVVQTPADVHPSQGMNPAQPGDTETPQWQDPAVANQPTTVVPGTDPVASPASSAPAAEPAPGVVAVQEALAASAAPTDQTQEGGDQ